VRRIGLEAADLLSYAATDSVQALTFRPIHYLGSKLRFVDRIVDTLTDMNVNGPICDLFSGSGTVTIALSQQFAVTAVDIQEYARVLASAVLDRDGHDGCRFPDLRISDEAVSLQEQIDDAVGPILAFERRALDDAKVENYDLLSEIAEIGSLASGGDALVGARSELQAAVRDTRDALRQLSRRTTLAVAFIESFGGLYFSFGQAAYLAALLAAAHRVSRAELRDGALAPLLSCASELANTVGKHFAQPIRIRDLSGRIKPHMLARVARDRSKCPATAYRAALERFLLLPKPPHRGTAYRADYATFLSQTQTAFGAVYADPPYTRDHYSRYYHVLETMARGDVPEISKTKIRARGERLSRGMYRLDRHQSPFSIISQAPAAFETLISRVAALGIPLLISYSPFEVEKSERPRTVSVEEIVGIALRKYSDVDVVAIDGVAHSKLNKQSTNADVRSEAELLIRCR
jgi:adenine-specific DNA methylase